jgi:hypothetical protein
MKFAALFPRKRGGFDEVAISQLKEVSVSSVAELAAAVKGKRLGPREVCDQTSWRA